MIEELDVPTRQVMVEARIVEAKDGFSRDLGVKFGVAGSKGRNAWGNSWSNAQDNHNTNSAVLRGDANYRTWSLQPNISLPAAAATNNIALVRALSSGALGLEISASEANW